MMKFISARTLQRWIKFWPPMLGAGIRIKEISDDYRHLVVSMKLRRYNRNYVGTHYGGSLFSMTDPFYMLMLLNILGPKYYVWDKTSKIDYVAPGKTEVFAKFQLSEDQIKDIVKRSSDGAPLYVDFKVDILDTNGDVVAKVDKTLYIRKKK